MNVSNNPQPATVRSVLCMMQSCGSQNYSGEFSFRIGFPVRCTGSALVMIIIPNVCALAPLLLLLLLPAVSRDSPQCATVVGLLPPRPWAAKGAWRVRHVVLPSLERQVLVPHVPQHAADQGDKCVLAAAPAVAAAAAAGVKQASQAAVSLDVHQGTRETMASRSGWPSTRPSGSRQREDCCPRCSAW